MVSPVNPSNQNVKTSIFYINDLHGQIPKMEQLTSASLAFDTTVKKENVDGLKLSSGDIFIGRDPKRNQVAATFLNIADIDASVLGNHEFDPGISLLAKILKDTKDITYLGMNMNIPEKSELKGTILRSQIITKNNHKYGLIGVQPQGIGDRLKGGIKSLEGITIDNVDQTRTEIQEEVNKLKTQGVNKVILLSHAGSKDEKDIAQSVTGIDVILGGHSHDLIKDIEEGENLLYSPSGEPVIITQAGRDGNNFGVLDVEFDTEGKVVKAQNNVQKTGNYNKNLLMSTVVDKVLGPSLYVGKLKYADPFPENLLLEESAYANFFTDAVREATNSDIVLLNAANVRGSLQKGTITQRDISSIFPFKNELIKVSLSEKDLIDAIKLCAKSFQASDNKPGIMQASGLTYKVNKQGEVLEANFIDKNNNTHKINVNNPDPNKKYITTYNNFMFEGGDGLSMLTHKDSIIEHYPYDTDKCGMDLIKNAKDQGVEIRKDGRIQIV